MALISFAHFEVLLIKRYIKTYSYYWHHPLIEVRKGVKKLLFFFSFHFYCWIHVIASFLLLDSYYSFICSAESSCIFQSTIIVHTVHLKRMIEMISLFLNTVPYSFHSIQCKDPCGNRLDCNHKPVVVHVMENTIGWGVLVQLMFKSIPLNPGTILSLHCHQQSHCSWRSDFFRLNG